MPFSVLRVVILPWFLQIRLPLAVKLIGVLVFIEIEPLNASKLWACRFFHTLALNSFEQRQFVSFLLFIMVLRWLFLVSTTKRFWNERLDVFYSGRLLLRWNWEQTRYSAPAFHPRVLSHFPECQSCNGIQNQHLVDEIPSLWRDPASFWEVKAVLLDLSVGMLDIAWLVRRLTNEHCVQNDA